MNSIPVDLRSPVGGLLLTLKVIVLISHSVNNCVKTDIIPIFSELIMLIIAYMEVH